MTLSPNATYGPGLPPYLPQSTMPPPTNDISSLVTQLVGLTTLLTQMLGPAMAGMAGPGLGQGMAGQSALGGGPNGGPAGCSMGGGAGCGGQDAAGGGAQISGGAPTPGRAADPLRSASGGGPSTPEADTAPDADVPPVPVAEPAPAPAPPTGPPPPPPGPPNRGQEAVDAAKQHLGTPYVWGGDKPGGFDCSGLMQFTLKGMGIDIPRTSEAQFTSGAPIDKKDLQPGDLVFFRGDPPGHVGMYIGNGEYIHAPQSGDVVKISKLDSAGSFSGARRYT